MAIFSNGARVAGTGMAAHWIGPQAAEGFLHEFSGWVVFAVATAGLLAVQRSMAAFEFPTPWRRRLEVGR